MIPHRVTSRFAATELHGQSVSYTLAAEPDEKLVGKFWSQQTKGAHMIVWIEANDFHFDYRGRARFTRISLTQPNVNRIQRNPAGGSTMFRCYGITGPLYSR
jgi:hypothetical protein